VTAVSLCVAPDAAHEPQRRGIEHDDAVEWPHTRVVRELAGHVEREWQIPALVDVRRQMDGDIDVAA
jgi:hypothetical protein